MKRFLKLIIFRVMLVMSYFFPLIRKILETRSSQTPITYRMWFIQKVLGFNRKAHWPVHHASLITHPDKISIGVDTSPGYMPGCYIQGRGGISLGDYTQISCNVGIISENHSVYDLRNHVLQPSSDVSITIGKYCWIGMNSIILPGVKLGDHTIVGAGSVVTKSFPNGFCIIAGNPAKIIKTLEEKDCVQYRNSIEYCGYIRRKQ